MTFLRPFQWYLSHADQFGRSVPLISFLLTIHLIKPVRILETLSRDLRIKYVSRRRNLPKI
jgi:hypothetical protein